MVGVFEDKAIEDRRVSVEAYSLPELNELLTGADRIQHTGYQTYWDGPFTIIVEGTGVGTLTIPLLEEVNITNQQGEVLCARAEKEVSLPENIGMTYTLQNQGQPAGDFMENLNDGFFYDNEKQYLGKIEEPDWDNDASGTYVSLPDGTRVVRLSCEPEVYTMTIEYLTEDFRLTPEQQMDLICYYDAKRREACPLEYSPWDGDEWYHQED